MRFVMGSLLLCVTLAAVGCGSKKEEQAGGSPVPVKVETVVAQDVRQSWRYSGEIRAETEVKLAFKQGGYVASLHQVRGADKRLRNVQPGDQVAAGTVLARLRQGDYQAQMNSATGQEKSSAGSVGAAQADLAQAKADQAEADLAFERAEALYAAKAMTRPDYDDAVSQHKAALAKVDGAMQQIAARQGQLGAAQAQVASAKLALGDTNLTSTMPAVIVSREVEPGSLVASGSTGFTIADTRVVKVEFGVPDGMLAHFKMGAAVPVSVDALGPTPLTGHITQIAASADRDSRVFNIQISLPNRDRALKLGMIASVEIRQAGGRRPMPLVPVTALSTTESGSDNFSVFVVREDNGRQLAQLRSVRIGETVGRSIAIREGLIPGDRIIVNRPNQLADGGAVRIVD